MYSHGYNWREEPEGTSISSVVLLLVFVGAAAFLASMMYFRPWDEDAPPATIPEAQASPAAPAPEGEAAAQPPPAP